MIDALLRKLDVRSPLTAAERDALAAAFLRPTTFQSGETIVAQGSAPKTSTLQLSGLSARVTTLRSGARQITALHVPGDMVDLHSFVLAKMDHSIVAIGDCAVCAMTNAKLREITERFPHLGRMLWLCTTLNAAIHRQWLVAMGRMDALGQMAHLLCELNMRLKVVGVAEDHQFEFPATQSSFADLLGMTPVHVNRMLQKLRAQDLVNWTGSVVKILDWDRLALLAEFDPTYLQLEPIGR